MYGWIVLQLLLLYTRLYSSKIYLNPLDVKDVYGSNNNEEVIVVSIKDPLRSKNLKIEGLEPSKSLVIKNLKSEKNDLAIDGLKLNDEQKNILRKRWQSSCDRKASKVCIQACKNTAKSICSSFKCRKSMKRSFKKECKRNCRARFLSSKASDTE